MVSVTETSQSCLGGTHPELLGCITTLTVCNVMEVANFCAAMDTLIDQDGGNCVGKVECLNSPSLWFITFNLIFRKMFYVMCHSWLHEKTVWCEHLVLTEVVLIRKERHIYTT